VTRAGWLLLPDRAVPPDDAWLSQPERQVQADLRFERRRRDWRLGRWAAKAALEGYTGESQKTLSVLADPDGAPHVFLNGRPAPWAVSLSHRGGHALCAVAAAGTRLGCDLESIEPRSEAFLADYLTPAEQRCVQATPDDLRPQTSNLIWSAKESAVKALGVGWRVDTRSVEVTCESTGGEAGWRPLRVLCSEPRSCFHGWWRREGSQVLTLVTSPEGPAPARIKPDRPWAASPVAAHRA
jgi:4'-phosphopantetheinyl transferase